MRRSHYLLSAVLATTLSLSAAPTLDLVLTQPVAAQVAGSSDKAAAKEAKKAAKAAAKAQKAAEKQRQKEEKAEAKAIKKAQKAAEKQRKEEEKRCRKVGDCPKPSVGQAAGNAGIF